MKVKEMMEALQLNRESDKPNQLMTVWGEHLRRDSVLSEYPRPQMVRDNYTILNGKYEYAITHSTSFPQSYDGEILVPFSPEAALSGVNRQLKPNEALWYRKSFFLNKIPPQKRLLLHFGACDERCRVYVNKHLAGQHSGGYQAFSFDITSLLVEGENILQICVRDKSDTSYHGRGKQMLNNAGMFYTAQSGIWQTVWYEWVPEVYLERIHILPRYDEDSVEFVLFPNKKAEQKEEKRLCRIVIYEDGIAISEQTAYDGTTLVLAVPNKKSWSPVRPFLYQVVITYGEDEISSYFGMRLFSVERDIRGVPRLCLNHVPYFQKGVLDQGYWPEGLLTPPSDEAMIHDIQMAKKLGYNMIRKHCKIEPMRWYYHCDRLGMLVWQDMINGGENYNLVMTSYLPTVFKKLRSLKDNHYGYTSRLNPKGRREWKKECVETIEQLYNSPSVCTWVLFNEGWGQFDAVENTKMVCELDDSRWIDAHSGWFDQNAGDMRSVHIYFFDLIAERSKKPYVISEYGGLAYGIAEHSYSKEVFGYGNYDTAEEFQQAYQSMEEEIELLREKGLCAAVYTQLTDIEEEVNGLLTYDRKISKLEIEKGL